jgi:hypothetical protein
MNVNSIWILGVGEQNEYRTAPRYNACTSHLPITVSQCTVLRDLHFANTTEV